jgi:hypothetical protein
MWKNLFWNLEFWNFDHISTFISTKKFKFFLPLPPGKFPADAHGLSLYVSLCVSLFMSISLSLSLFLCLFLFMSFSLSLSLLTLPKLTLYSVFIIQEMFVLMKSWRRVSEYWIAVARQTVSKSVTTITLSERTSMRLLNVTRQLKMQTWLNISKLIKRKCIWLHSGQYL